MEIQRLITFFTKYYFDSPGFVLSCGSLEVFGGGAYLALDLPGLSDSRQVTGRHHHGPGNTRATLVTLTPDPRRAATFTNRPKRF